jgi:hypothetical protein
MGLDTTAVKFICAARSSGVDFAETVMIGRQNFIPTPKVLNRVFSVAGVTGVNAKSFISEHTFADKFFELMGAKLVHSLDYSPYQDATIIQDMNAPIPENLRGNYSVVYDGGTIEHVFNMPQALKNCMEMVKIGGHFMQANIANNFMGHGFWQFSPELLFRALSKENGFQVETILLHEVLPDAGWTCRNDAWYAVADPDEVQQRVELCNAFPTGGFNMEVLQSVTEEDGCRSFPFKTFARS